MKYISIALMAIFFLTSCKGNAQKGQDQSNLTSSEGPENVKNHQFPVQKSEAQWKKELTEQQFYILREAGTEPRNSSELLHIKGDGLFICAACGNPLFKNKHQFDSGTGWPSFDQPVKNGVVLATDTKLGYKRNEVLCARCGGHLGHRFDDGPRETTGLRYCMDGAAMNFMRAKDKTVQQLIENQEESFNKK